MKLHERISGFFENKKHRTAALMAGGAAAAYALGLATPDFMALMHETFQYVTAHAPQVDPITHVTDFVGGGMKYIATVGVGIADWAADCGIEVGRQVRDALTEMRNFLGDGVEGARKLFHGTISQTSEFLEAAAGFVKEHGPKDMLDAGKMVIGGLAAVSGAWEGLKLCRAAYRRIFGGKEAEAQAAAPQTPQDEVRNIQINIAFNGGQVAEDKLEQVAAAISAEAPRLSPEVMEATQQAIRRAAEQAARDKVALSRMAGNDDARGVLWQADSLTNRPRVNYNPGPSLTIASNDDHFEPDFDPDLKSRTFYPAADDRSPTQIIRHGLASRGEDAAHPDDIAEISDSMRWLMDADIDRAREQTPQAFGGGGHPIVVDDHFRLRVISRGLGDFEHTIPRRGDNDNAPSPMN